MGATNGNSNVFISYAWKNTDIVDEIDKDFMRVGITLTRDVRDLKDYGSISEFMKSLRDSDYVLMVISDAYLKSRNCMHEVLEIKKEKNYGERILPILLDDARQIFQLEGRAEYIKFWQDELLKAKKS